MSLTLLKKQNIKKAAEWIKDAEKSANDMDKLYDKLGDTGMSSDEKYIFNMQKETR